MPATILQGILMKTFKSFLSEGKSPYTPEQEEDIVRFHANGVKRQQKTKENFNMNHVQEYVQDKHPNAPSNIATIRRYVLNRVHHNRIQQRIKEKNPRYVPIDLGSANKRIRNRYSESQVTRHHIRQQIPKIQEIRGEGHDWSVVASRVSFGPKKTKFTASGLRRKLKDHGFDIK